jgi:multiple sugar transport system substrate-binding protein
MNRPRVQRDGTFRIAVRRFGPFESALQKQWQSFESRAGTGLHFEEVALDLEQLHRRLFSEGGLANGRYDLAMISTDWVAEANASGGLLDVSPYLVYDPPVGYPDAWSESLLRLQRFGDRILGLPYHDGPECLIYRRDLFEDSEEQQRFQQKYGEPLRVPPNWDEFRRLARYFTRAERGLYGTVFAGYPDGHNTVYDFCLQIWSRGGELFDEKNCVRLDTPEAQAALEFYRRLFHDSNAIHPGSAAFDSVKSGMAFAAGEVAMMVNWFGFAGMAEAIETSKVKGKTAIAAIPSETGRGISLNAYWILGIAAGCLRRETAWEFVSHCASPEMDKLLTLEGGIGCRKSTWSAKQVNDVIPYYHRLEELHENARDLPRMTNWSGLAEVIDRMMLDVIQTEETIAVITERAQRAARAWQNAGVPRP